MAVRGRRTREGGDGGGYWRWLKVRPGTSGSGWIAGDVHSYPAHMGRPSVVCVKTLTNGRLHCDLCDAKTPVRDLGYLPIYRDDYVQCVLIIHEYTFDAVDQLSHLSPILWGKRDDDDAEAVYVRPHVAGRRFESAVPARLVRQNITIATARYWKRPDLLPDLSRWFAGVTDAVTDVVPAAIAERAAAKPVTDAAGAKRHKSQPIESVTGEKLPPLLTDGMKDMLRRNRNLAAALEKNGKPESV